MAVVLDRLAAAVAVLDDSIYGSTGSHMKTTFDIPDDLMVRAKKRAAEMRKPLRELVTEGLRAQLAGPKAPSPARSGPARRIRWITSAGGLPPGLDLTSREPMHGWLRRHR